MEVPSLKFNVIGGRVLARVGSGEDVTVARQTRGHEYVHVWHL